MQHFFSFRFNFFRSTRFTSFNLISFLLTNLLTKAGQITKKTSQSASFLSQGVLFTYWKDHMQLNLKNIFHTIEDVFRDLHVATWTNFLYHTWFSRKWHYVWSTYYNQHVSKKRSMKWNNMVDRNKYGIFHVERDFFVPLLFRYYILSITGF